MLDKYKLARIAQILGMEADAATDQKIAFAFTKLKPYSRGIVTEEILSMGLFASERQLCEELVLVSKKGEGMGMATMLVDLPEIVLSAFKNRNSIQTRWLFQLMRAHSSNQKIVTEICQKIVAGRAAGERWPASKVFKTINQVGRGQV